MGRGGRSPERWQHRHFQQGFPYIPNPLTDGPIAHRQKETGFAGLYHRSLLPSRLGNQPQNQLSPIELKASIDPLAPTEMCTAVLTHPHGRRNVTPCSTTRQSAARRVGTSRRLRFTYRIPIYALPSMRATLPWIHSSGPRKKCRGPPSRTLIRQIALIHASRGALFAERSGCDPAS